MTDISMSNCKIFGEFFNVDKVLIETCNASTTSVSSTNIAGNLFLSDNFMVLSQFLQHKIYYKTPKKLEHFDKSRGIDFGLDIAHITNYNPLYNTKEIKKL